MAKIVLDKYYTPSNIAIELIEQTLNFIGRDNIDTIIEPSAGNGAFSNYLFDTYSHKYKILAFDIQPEEDRIIEQDFLKLNLQYNDKCLIIENPPFGVCNVDILHFFNKSITLGKYIAFILPISQLNNTNSIYKYNLTYSKCLGILNYSDRNLHCCFNVYEQPQSGILNKKISNKIEGIDIIYKRDGKQWDNVKTCDLCMIRWV